MIENNIKIEYKDIVNYWMKLYPEIEGTEVLENILTNVSGKNLEQLEKRSSEMISKEILKRMFPIRRDRYLEQLFDRMDIPFIYYYYPVIKANFGSFFYFVIKEEKIEEKDTFIVTAITSLLNNLSLLAQRMLILEVNIARENGSLKGESKEERFEYFKNHLLKEEEYVRELYNEYYSLTELMDLKVKKYLSFVKEIVENIKTDEAVLSEHFYDSLPLGKIKKVISDTGDTYAGGKTVMGVEFESGQKFIYKPRGLEMEERFARLLNWINEKGGYSLKVPKLYSKKKYGWMEFVDSRPCKNIEQVKSYYQREGELLALLFLFNGKNFHRGNIIAQGEYPVIIDWGSVFHSLLQIYDQSLNDSMSAAYEIFGDSVYPIGLLPRKTAEKTEKTEKTEEEGLAPEIENIRDRIRSPWSSPLQTMVISNKNKDDIRIEKSFKALRNRKNNPHINLKIQKAKDYVKSIKSGFSSMAKWMMENRGELEEKIQTFFRGTEIRYSIRPVDLYKKLLRTSFHPDFLRESIHREVLLHRIGINANSVIKPLLELEYKDLLQGDLPVFSGVTDEKSLVGSGGQMISDFFTRTPMEIVLEKLQRLTPEMLQRQLYFIDMSFQSKRNSDRKEEKTGAYNENEFVKKGNREERQIFDKAYREIQKLK